MSQSLSLQIVRRARSLIANPSGWCQGVGYLDAAGNGHPDDLKLAVQFCAWAALCRATGDLIPHANADIPHTIAVSMVPEIKEKGMWALFDINDNLGHAAVLALFDDFILRAQM
jgi:hypothetical protein